MTIKSDQHGFEVQAARPALSQNVVIGVGSLQSLAFSTGPVGGYSTASANYGSTLVTPNNTSHVRLVATSDCYIAFGANPTAVAGAGMLITASTPEYFWVAPGEKLAVIQVAAGGILNITECMA
jgi:hypothetical protein